MIKKKILLNVHEMLNQKIGLRQGYIMARIGNSRANSSEIREDGGIDKANMSADIRKLLRRGIIKVRPSEEDRRFSVLQLTDKGKKLLKLLSTR
jgi:DNA-binding MarR family transcriptional regulator